MAQPTLSLSMIVRDAEETVGNALKDASQFCDELVVVDTGSADNTVEIVRSFGARIFHFDWINDFSAARNFAADQCLGTWILWLDADDRIPSEAWPGFQLIVDGLDKLAQADAVLLPYHRSFAADNPSVCTYSLECVRMWRRNSRLRWMERIHEYLRQDGEDPIAAIRRDNAWVEHRPLSGHVARSLVRNRQIIEACLASGDRSPRLLCYHVFTLASEDRHSEALEACEEILRDPALGAAIPDEVRYDLLAVAAISAASLEIPEKKVEFLAQAMILDPERAEPLVELGKHFYEKREWHRAMPFFAAATTLHRPEFGARDPALYSYLPWDYLAICASEIGDFKKAMDYTMRALPGHPDKQRLVANLDVYAKHL